MNLLVPSVIYRYSNRTVGDAITFTPAEPITGTSVSFTPPIAAPSTPAATGFSWNQFGQSLLNLGGNVATGLANLSLQKAQFKAQAEMNRPIYTSQPAYTPPPAYQSGAYSGGFGGFTMPSMGDSSGGMNNKLLLYGGGAAVLGLIAFLALKKN